MLKLNPYLNLPGRCREVMNFYARCLQAELQMQTVGESPMAAQMPPHTHNQILHAVLTKGDLVLMASDMFQGEPVQGNTYQLTIVCDQEAEIKQYFQALSEGGTIDMPLQSSFWSPLFGMVTDQYGQGWMLSLETKP